TLSCRSSLRMPLPRYRPGRRAHRPGVALVAATKMRGTPGSAVLAPAVRRRSQRLVETFPDHRRGPAFEFHRLVVEAGADVELTGDDHEVAGDAGGGFRSVEPGAGQHPRLTENRFKEVTPFGQGAEKRRVRRGFDVDGGG